MPLCDLCGEERPLFKVEIEKARLKVCSECSKYGTVLSAEKPAEKQESDFRPLLPQKRTVSPVVEQTESPIDDNYSILVKTAREKAKLTQEELAKAIAEKENIIQRIELRQQEPSLKTAKKLEQFLHIKLIINNKPHSNASLSNIDFSEANMTIGDLLKLSKDFKDLSD